MSLKAKNRFKPIFKQSLRLRENVQNRQKILKFKKKSGNLFLYFIQTNLKIIKNSNH